MNSTQTATPIMTQPLTLANLTPKQRAFIEYFYINVYNPLAPLNLWNPSIGSTLFSRSLVKSLCKKFGYGGTIQWIVRKPFGRRGERGLYNIPEIKELVLKGIKEQRGANIYLDSLVSNVFHNMNHSFDKKTILLEIASTKLFNQNLKNKVKFKNRLIC
jgi:hypothetical protein